MGAIKYPDVWMTCKLIFCVTGFLYNSLCPRQTSYWDVSMPSFIVWFVYFVQTAYTVVSKSFRTSQHSVLGENGRVVSRSMASNAKYEPVSFKDQTFNTDAGRVDNCGPEILTDVKTGGLGNDKHEDCVTSRSKFDDSDSGPEEAPILRESSVVQDSGNSNTCDKSQENNNIARNPRKRRRHHKHSHKAKSAPNEKTESVSHERRGSNRPFHVKKRKLTLLEKVSRSCYFFKAWIHGMHFVLSCVSVKDILIM